MAYSYELTPQQLKQLLHEVLKLSDQDLDLLNYDRLAFLNKINAVYNRRLPFQNLSHTCVPFEQRHMPTIQENINTALSGIGGRCWTLNSVMYVVLKELGFKVIPSLASVAAAVEVNQPALTVDRGNHMINLVRSVKEEGDFYLMDSFSYAAHQVIPLDFETESPVYKVPLATIRWLKRGGFYIRQELYNQVNPVHKMLTREGKWVNIMYFSGQEKSIKDIHTSIDKICYANRKSKFNTTRRICGINEDLNKFVAIRNDKLMLEDQNGNLTVTVLGNDHNVCEAVKKYFPDFPQDYVSRSYKVWNEFDRDVLATMATKE